MKNLLNDSGGFALVFVMVTLTMLLTATGGALVFSQLGLKMTSHHRTGTMAFFATEAGISHAWKELENGDGNSDFEQVYDSAPQTLIVSNNAFSGAAYEVRLQKSVNNPRMILVASEGTAPNNSRARLEVWLRKDLGRSPKAIITNGDIRIDGNPKIMGTRGGAHTNEDMRVDGNPGVQMVDGLTASNQTMTDGGVANGMDISGNPCIGSPECSNPPGQQPDANRLDTRSERNSYEAAHSNAPVENIPMINPADYAQAVAGLQEGYICRLDGQVYQGGHYSGGQWLGGTPMSPPTGWACHNGNFQVNSNNAASGVFYAEGEIRISGSPGSSGSPLQATLIARDHIEISGSPHIQPYPTVPENLTNVLLITGNDLKISGNMRADYAPGGILVHQQFEISGNPNVNGFVIAGDGQPTWPGDPFTNSSHHVTINRISGNPTITYNADAGITLLPPAVTQVGWYQSF